MKVLQTHRYQLAIERFNAVPQAFGGHVTATKRTPVAERMVSASGSDA